LPYLHFGIMNPNPESRAKNN